LAVLLHLFHKLAKEPSKINGSGPFELGD
jgi:hypothetical protein